MVMVLLLYVELSMTGQTNELHTRKIADCTKIRDAQKSKPVYPNKRKQWKKSKEDDDTKLSKLSASNDSSSSSSFSSSSSSSNSSSNNSSSGSSPRRKVLVDPLVVKITMTKVIEILQRHTLFVLRGLLRVFFCQTRFHSQFANQSRF